MLTVWLAWLALMAGSNLAAPLYSVYARQFRFSNLVLTLVFAAYAAALVPALLLFGRVSDRFGRRPVIMAGLACAASGLVLFAAARSTGWLFAARAAQGVAVGMISGAATAALVELEPTRASWRPALLAGLAQTGGSALGPLLAGMLAQWAPDPRRLSYLVGLGATVVTAGFVAAVPEPTRRAPEPWRVQRPRVPSGIRIDFARVSLTAATMWGTAALYVSIVPSYASTLLATRNLALLGTVGAVALASSCLAQLASTRRRDSCTGPARARWTRDQAVGLGLLTLGLVALVLASPLHSLAVLLAAAVTGGTGHGVGFVSAQAELNAMAPPQRRAEVSAAFICCIYVAVAAGVIATGLLDLRVSLPDSVGAVALAFAAIAAATTAWQARAFATSQAMT